MFGSKSKKAEVISTEIDGITKTFTTMVTSLIQKAEEAETIKKATEEDIEAMQAECVNLQAVSDRAHKLIDKITNIFD
jgi:hypothetical protein